MHYLPAYPCCPEAKNVIYTMSLKDAAQFESANVADVDGADIDGAQL